MTHPVLALDRTRATTARLPRVMTIIDTMTIGGAGKVVLQFFEHADPTRVEHVLCNFRYNKPRSTEFNDAARQIGMGPELFSQASLIDPAPLLQAYRLARAGRYTIVETHGYKSNLIGLFLRATLGLRWIVYLHGWTAESPRMRYYRKFDEFCIRRADCVIGVSPTLVSTAARLRANRANTHLVLNGIDPRGIAGSGDDRESTRARLGITHNSILVGCFGRLSSEKGQTQLILAWRALTLPRPAKLLILGDGPDAAQLKQRVASEGMADRVIFVPHSSTMREYYDAIDILVIPSLSEGLPFVLLEAMALGKPVIATAVGAIPEVLVDDVNGWLIHPGDTFALTHQLQCLIDNPTRIDSVSQRARETVLRRFSALNHAEQLVSIYESLT
ncbi:MAG: glycosyltransferase family 4 protein [Thiotrichales bacterium]